MFPVRILNNAATQTQQSLTKSLYICPELLDRSSEDLRNQRSIWKFKHVQNWILQIDLNL